MSVLVSCRKDRRWRQAMNWHNCPECGRARPTTARKSSWTADYILCCGKLRSVPPSCIVRKTQAAAMAYEIELLKRENAELRGKR